MKKNIFLLFITITAFSLHAMDESVSLLEVAINDYNKAQYAFAINNLTKYLQIAESDDNKPTAYYYLSLSYYFTNDYKMSMKYFNELISRYRSSSYSSLSHFWIGLISQNLGEWEEADESFYKYVALYPHSDIADKAYLAAANCRIAANRYTDAEETLRTLITKYPKSDKYEEASVLYAYILMCNVKNDEATAFLERWVNRIGDTGEKYPYRDRFWLYLAELYMDKDLLIEAKALLKKIDIYSNESSSHDVSLLRLAQIESRLGKEKAARQYVERLSEEYPNSTYNLDSTLLLGMIAADKGEYEDAVTFFTQVSDASSRRLAELAKKGVAANDEQSLRILKIHDESDYYSADTYEKLEDWESANDLFRQIAAGDGHLSKLSILRVIQLCDRVEELEVTDYDLYTYISQNEPKLRSDTSLYEKVSLYKGRLEYNLGKFSDCIRTVDSIGNDKYLATIASIKTNALLKLRKDEEARNYLESAFDRMPIKDKAETAFDIMNLYFGAGLYQQALKYYPIITAYSKSLPMDAKTNLYIKTGYLRGLIFLQQKNNKKSYDILSSIVTQSAAMNLNDDAKKLVNQTYYYLGWLCYRQNEFASAANNFQMATTLVEDETLRRDSFFMEAWSYFSDKNYSVAVRKFELIYQKYTKDNLGMSALFRCGKCYENLGSKVKADEIYNRIVTEYPNSYFVPNALLELVKTDLEKRDFIAANKKTDRLQNLSPVFYYQALLLQAQAYLSQERYSEAYSIYNYCLLSDFFRKGSDAAAKDNIRYWTAYCAEKTNDDISASELLADIGENSALYMEASQLLLIIYGKNNQTAKEKTLLTEIMPKVTDKVLTENYAKRLSEIALMEKGFSKEEAKLALKAESGEIGDKYQLALFYVQSADTQNVEKGITLMKDIAAHDKGTIGAKANLKVADKFLDENVFDEASKLYLKSANEKNYDSDNEVKAESLYKCAYCYYRLGKTSLFDFTLNKLKTDFAESDWTGTAIELEKRVRR